MAWVVFLRGVNVGGHKPFRPSVVAGELSQLDVVNVGAAGTFVVRKAIPLAALRAALTRKLPFAADMMICRAQDVGTLLAGDPLPKEAAGGETTRFVSVLEKRPRPLPALPIRQPAGDDWQVMVMELRGRFALSLHRRTGRKLIYPNEVVEKRLGVAATTRNWNTIRAIGDILRLE
jgi:uncharacterized protein (DUF1697 family)